MTAVRLRFVGSGDAFAAGGRFNTCFHLSGGEEPILIDCGASSLVALKRQGIDVAAVAVVVLSHLHRDHPGGLPWLTLDGPLAKRTDPLVIAGPPDAKTTFRQQCAAL